MLSPLQYLTGIHPKSYTRKTFSSNSKVQPLSQNRLIQLRATHPQQQGIAIYAGSSVTQATQDAAYKLAKELAKISLNGKAVHFVNGAGGGSMESFARGIHEAKGQLIGLTTNELETMEKRTETYYSHIFKLDNLEKRKREGFDRLTAYAIALPGGYGTLDEILDRSAMLYYNNTLNEPEQYRKQVILYDPNKNGYYDGLIAMENAVRKEIALAKGKALKDIPSFLMKATTPQEVIQRLQQSSELTK